MLITREIDYSFRILRAIADGKIHSVKPMCDAESIPWKFAYKILGKLRDAGIVQNISGVHGGCRLIVDLHDVTALDIFTIVDGKPYVNRCMEQGYVCEWVTKKGTPCGINHNLSFIQKEFEDMLSKYSMYTLIFEDLYELSGSGESVSEEMIPESAEAEQKTGQAASVLEA
ncbi:MAG: Rrf2 family transcriptional regulator [Eubacteriales bacterium]|nr:Rrf2 family transcriptional regulator [Eubacteriales bacterium]